MSAVLVARLDDLRDGHGVEVVVAGRRVALFRDGERVHALDAECPHRQGPLADGWLAGDCVECPWHGWRFRLETGRSPRNPDMRVGVHRAYVADGEVWVDVGDGRTGAASP